MPISPQSANSRADDPAAVTVIINTYNHAPFIAEALDGVLMQRTRERFDVVIIDDCSTDGTQAILTRYQQTFPDKIRLVLLPVNRWNNIAFMDAILGASSRYLSILDGDDYWTSHDKLQKQIDYLDEHPDCALCFHNVTVVYDDGHRPPSDSNPRDQKTISNLDDLIRGCFVETCSTMYRRRAITSFPPWYVNDRSPDWSLAVIAAQSGTVDYIEGVTAVYRKHAGGVWSGLTWEGQELRIIAFYENMAGYLPDPFASMVTALLAVRYQGLACHYAADGRGDAADEYFRKAAHLEPDRRRLVWSLRTADGNRASLVFPSDPGDSVKVDIERATTGVAFDIQLDLPHIPIVAACRYTIAFKARADSPRTLSVGVAHAEAPWSGLGYYRQLDLDEHWCAVRDDFIAVESTRNGRVHFDLGGHAAAVEIAAVSIDEQT